MERWGQGEIEKSTIERYLWPVNADNNFRGSMHAPISCLNVHIKHSDLTFMRRRGSVHKKVLLVSQNVCSKSYYQDFFYWVIPQSFHFKSLSKHAYRGLRLKWFCPQKGSSTKRVQNLLTEP